MQEYDEVFAASFARIMGSGAYNSDFIDRFYTVFLLSAPEISMRFVDTDMSVQKTMLHDSFTTLINFNQQRKLNAEMRRLGRGHSKHAANIPPKLYVLWLDSLLTTVAEFDPSFTSEVELAWRLTLAPGIAYLQHAYHHPPAEDAAAS